ncbi:hypothetical protein V6N12_045490 [Hibiscus sabdariffa]|uniref:Uncharacterized protein n=1 Tax=Hibiscus sabdariffa TaxID=183260 RepID=A0ABR2G3E8_9ROSI
MVIPNHPFGCCIPIMDISNAINISFKQPLSRRCHVTLLRSHTASSEWIAPLNLQMQHQIHWLDECFSPTNPLTPCVVHPTEYCTIASIVASKSLEITRPSFAHEEIDHLNS